MQDFIPLFAIFAVFGTITAIIVGPTYFKSRERQEMQATVRAAIDKGQPLPPEVIEALGKEATRNIPSRTRDIRRGIIWLATGIGIAAFSLINDLRGFGDDWNDGPNFDGGLLGLAAIPITIGLAFIVLSFFNKNKD
ncbi:MAG: hypothetical protein B7Y86_09860 [Brevundimonas subvibrioides]|uniref:DUF6249 domain-containing protein n=1 Tax=Brevundimonas subvibrioides TaxID=74313 RepID=A0A258HJ75_9CAUL|nr:DUF6249 domain-containing protein [Brevundimonas subvibrioides]OYX57031.1 MAG: hypothetical protein B7Y86_09860 [Brevundimonas subvibrioides]